MLKIARNECHQLLQQNKIKELETHLKTFEEQFKKLNNLKSKVQELMLEEDESIDYIEEWSSRHSTRKWCANRRASEQNKRIERRRKWRNKSRSDWGRVPSTKTWTTNWNHWLSFKKHLNKTVANNLDKIRWT